MDNPVRSAERQTHNDYSLCREVRALLIRALKQTGAQAQEIVCTISNDRNIYVGEMKPEDVEASMFHEENQRLEVLTIGDFASASETLTMLMGKEVSPRRDYLFENVDFSILSH